MFRTAVMLLGLVVLVLTALPVAHAQTCPSGYTLFHGKNGGTECRANSGTSGPAQVPTSQNLPQTGGGGSQNLPQTGGGADAATWETGNSTGGKASLMNPLGFNSITEVLLAILDVLVIFMIPIIVLFIIYAGFLYVTARGNQSTIETAHRTLAYAVVGGLLILGARALLAVIEGTVNQLL